MSSNVLRVSEIFGPALQGEGAQTGVRTLFVRFGGCDFRCSWCDSLYAVLPEHRPSWARLTPSEIVDQCTALATPATCPWVTLSGGNPALWDLGAVVALLQNAGYLVACETQGTIPKKWIADLDHLCISPKPPSSGMEWDAQAFNEVLRVAPRDHITKVVVFGELDLMFANDLATMFPYMPFFLTPGTEQDDSDPVPRLLAHTAWVHGRIVHYPALSRARIIPQLHTLIWGRARAV